LLIVYYDSKEYACLLGKFPSCAFLDETFGFERFNGLSTTVCTIEYWKSVFQEAMRLSTAA